MEKTLASVDGSIADLMRHALPGRDGLPLDIDAWKLIEGFSERIPSYLSQFWGFELALSHGTLSADLLLCVSKKDAFQLFIRSVIDEAFFSSKDQIGFSWLANHWQTSVKHDIANIWFEWDFDDIKTQNNRTNFFIAPNRQNNFLHTINLTHQIFTRFAEPIRIPFDYFPKFIEIYHALPTNSWISQIGMMCARNVSLFRLYIQNIPNTGLSKLLRDIKYPNIDTESVQHYLQKCLRFADQVNLDIDVGRTVGRKIGLECYFYSIQGALVFLDEMYAEGIVIFSKYECVRNYIKQIKLQALYNHVPFFSHFKLVCGPDASIELKAYTGVVHQDIARNVIRTKPLP